MNAYFFALMLFGLGYVLNMFYITVLYHRGLAHGSVTLHPLLRRFTIWSGSWVTGIDPKAWACMHRSHHLYSDTPNDPHSPVQLGTFGVMKGQLHSYQKTLVGLMKGDSRYTGLVRDLDFPVNWLNQKRKWLLPYLLHFGIALALSLISQHWFVGAAYAAGILSHPVQGWLVNAFAHRFGYENHLNGDHSRNNTIVAWLCMGEGYQNNHHANPASPKFSERWFEIDAGYGMCLLSESFGLLRISDEHRILFEVHP